MGKYLLKNGYFNAESLFLPGTPPFIFVLGGRGTGKTYGVTKWLCDHCDEGHKFILMRRTEEEMGFVSAGNIYAEHHENVEVKTKREKVVKVLRDGIPIGYHLALTAVSHIRGFSMMDVSFICFDEFIAERGTPVRRYSGEQMLNAYETINRNRELNGAPPVKCIFLSNFNTTESDIMNAFGFDDEIYTYKDVEPVGVYKDNGKMLVMVNHAPITDRKRETALYKVQNSKSFSEMALNNNGVEKKIPTHHYGRQSYEYLFTFGSTRINRLYSGMFYLTHSDRKEEIGPKEVLKAARVYKAYICGNVLANTEYTADTFLHDYIDEKM